MKKVKFRRIYCPDGSCQIQVKKWWGWKTLGYWTRSSDGTSVWMRDSFVNPLQADKAFKRTI
jgi:hypothetical protein